MSLFSDLHSSIFSARFYERISEKSAGEAVRFFILVCIGTAILSGAAHTYFSFDRKTGIAAQVSAMLNGMEFKNGSLDPHTVTPYVPGTMHLEKLLNMLLCVPSYFNALPDSYLVADTSANAPAKIFSTTKILFTAHNFYINPRAPALIKFSELLPDEAETAAAGKTARRNSWNNFMNARSNFILQVVLFNSAVFLLNPNFSVEIPYSLVLHEADLVVSEQTVQEFLKENITGLAVNFFMLIGIINSAVFLLSIVFLTFAAYIFRLERARKFGNFLKLACFAASPVYVGTNLVALSGTTFFWTWHVLILIATFVMFRGVMASQKNMGRPTFNE